jgi:hypothetical protein
MFSFVLYSCMKSWFSVYQSHKNTYSAPNWNFRVKFVYIYRYSGYSSCYCEISSACFMNLWCSGYEKGNTCRGSGGFSTVWECLLIAKQTNTKRIRNCKTGCEISHFCELLHTVRSFWRFVKLKSSVVILSILLASVCCTFLLIRN